MQTESDTLMRQCLLQFNSLREKKVLHDSAVFLISDCLIILRKEIVKYFFTSIGTTYKCTLAIL